MNGIVLDANVVSEPKRPRPDPAVRAWFARQDPDRLYLTTTVVGELAAGIGRMPRGRRRLDFEAWLKGLIDEDFAGRIFDFDMETAFAFGRLVANALAQGRPPQMGDAQIAAAATVHGMAVATRDVADFAAFAVPVIDPWAGG